MQVGKPIFLPLLLPLITFPLTHHGRLNSLFASSILPKDIFTFQTDIENRRRITWLVSIPLDETIDREEYIQSLKEKGIDVRPFFYPLSDMDIYKPYCKNYTPITHRISKAGLNFPTYENFKSMDEIKKILGKK